MRSISFLVILVSFLSAVIPLCVSAQERITQGPTVELKIEELGVAQGLSQGMIHGLDVDLKGYLWIGTKDGLNRYDGNHFHVFRHDPQDTNSIASNYIRSLHIDDRGLIWVGTNASGLDLYDPTQMRFIHFGNTMNPASPSMIQSVARIFSDPSGRVLIWDGTGDHCEILVPIPGADPMSINSWKLQSLDDLYQLPKGIPILMIYNMTGFGADGALIFGHQGNLYGLYPDHVKVMTKDVKKIYTPSGIVENLSSSHYFLDTRHHLYSISLSDRLVYKWDMQADSFQSLLQLPQDYPTDSYRFFVDHRNRIWSNGSAIPLYRIDTQQRMCQRTEVTRYLYAGTSAHDFSIVCEDHQHNLWASTGGNGIIKITSRNDQFNRKFFSSEKYLINRIVKNGFSFRVDDTFSSTQSKTLEDRLISLGIRLISPFAEDSKHRLYCVALDERRPQHFLIQINPGDFTFSKTPIDICMRPVDEASISIMFDRDDELWIATECIDRTATLMRLDDLPDEKDIFDFPLEVIRNEHAFVTDWYVDAANIFWIGTKQGLFRFNPNTKEWKHFRVDHSQANALSHNHILSICPDPATPDKYLWIGTDGGGLNKMDIRSETFSHYTTKDGLPNNVIYAVQSDAHNNLWLSTNLGLSRFDPVTADVWSFTVDDGLPGNEYNRREYGKANDGRLYFGGVEGVTSFDPEVFYISSDPSPIVINRLKLSNKEISYTTLTKGDAGQDYQLPAPLEHLQKLTFPYTERMITLGFSLLDFTNPAGNKYKYKLEGFNNEWIDAGEINEAVFTNLNPGSYTFLVSGRNSNNVWSDPAKLQLIIRSPWWGTWWFRIFVLAIVAGGVYAFYRYRLQQAMKLQHLRNRIAADLHDEIGSTLSSISLAGTVIRHKLKANHPEVDGLLHKINHNTQKMMEAMSDIVWAVNTKNDRFDQVLHRMRAFAVEILEPNDISIHFDSSPNITHLQLDMQQRKNLYLIFKEVIHNAAKYAQCQNVWVTLEHTHGRLKMEVKDDGIGFDLLPVKEPGRINHDIAIQKMGGNGIVNMYTRADELKGKLEMQSSPGEGMIVSLTFLV